MAKNVAFYFYSGDPELGRKAVAAVRLVMDAKIWHLSGPEAPSIDADEVLPYHEYNRIRHYSLMEGETVFLDTDVIVQKDLTHVFDEEFEAGFTTRPTGTHFQAGVMFGRSQDFWRRFAKFWELSGRGDTDVILNNFHEISPQGIKLFPPEYNYTPQSEDEDVSDKYAVHYKGNKKAWMVRRELPPYMNIHPTAQISPHARIYASHLKVGAGSRIDDGVVITGHVVIGENVHITPYCVLMGNGRIEIGDYSAIGTGTTLISDSDDYSGQALFGLVPNEYRNRDLRKVTLERYCVVGVKSTLMPGVVLGEGVSIGAHSFVKTSCKPWTMHAGTPARLLRKKDRTKFLGLLEELGRLRELHS